MKTQLMSLLITLITIFSLSTTCNAAENNHKNPEAAKLNILHNLSHCIEILQRETFLTANFMRDKDIMILTTDEVPDTFGVESDNFLIYFYNGLTQKVQQNIKDPSKKEFLLKAMEATYKEPDYKKLDPVTQTVPEGQITTYAWDNQVVQFSLVSTKLKSGKELLSLNVVKKIMM